MVMLLYLDNSFERFKREGAMRNANDLWHAIHDGAVKRIRPKTMTVATAFIGLVPLGVGHQVPTTPATGGHGWALRVASIAALLSIASASGSWTFSMTSCAPPLP